MPATDSPAVIVARYLRANNYNEALNAFVKEAGLPADAGVSSNGDLTIEQVLEEKKTFDISVRFEKFGISEENAGWSLPAPYRPEVVATLPTSTNLLHVCMSKPQSTVLEKQGISSGQILSATTADRRLNLLHAARGFPLIKSYNTLQDSPILSCLFLDSPSLVSITTGMSGQIVLYDHTEGKVLDERRDHSKYVVKVVASEDPKGVFIATAGWDGMVILYRLNRTDDKGYKSLGSPIASIKLQSNPESLLFISNPDMDSPVLLVTRRDSTTLYYYSTVRIEGLGTIPSLTNPMVLTLLGTQNLTPHANAWVAFSPSSLALCPTDPDILAIATSALPTMKLIIVRLLLPLLGSSAQPPMISAAQVARVRAALPKKDREEAAILVHTSTEAPQTNYSTPQVCWRPDGSGVWVNGDDGILRGIEAKTGKVIAKLNDGHDPGTKIRSIWAGWVGGDEGKEEWVVSGGFDRKLVVWKAGGDADNKSSEQV